MNLNQFQLLKFDEVLFIILKVEDNFTKIFALNLHSSNTSPYNLQSL